MPREGLTYARSPLTPCTWQGVLEQTERGSEALVKEKAPQQLFLFLFACAAPLTVRTALNLHHYYNFSLFTVSSFDSAAKQKKITLMYRIHEAHSEE